MTFSFSFFESKYSTTETVSCVVVPWHGVHYMCNVHETAVLSLSLKNCLHLAACDMLISLLKVYTCLGRHRGAMLFGQRNHH